MEEGKGVRWWRVPASITLMEVAGFLWGALLLLPQARARRGGAVLQGGGARRGCRVRGEVAVP
jgi:hypothetical protein